MNNVIMRVRNFFAAYFISPPPFCLFGAVWDQAASV